MLASTVTKIFAVFVVGMPLCLVGGGLYSLASGKSVVDGFVAAYGALYKVPGTRMAMTPTLPAFGLYSVHGSAAPQFWWWLVRLARQLLPVHAGAAHAGM